MMITIQASLAFRGCIMLAPVFAGGCASQMSIADEMFAEKYSCPSNKVSVHPRGDQVIEVVGCGQSTQYSCYRFTQPCGLQSPGRCSERDVCSERSRYVLEATDGTRHQTWDGLDEEAAASKEAAIVSATHDLPCDVGSIVVLAKDSSAKPTLLEGCGQRVTYQIVDNVAPQGLQHVIGQRYVLVGRVPTVRANPASP